MTQPSQRNQSLDEIVDREHPWPGLSAFTEADNEFFHGRETEAEELFGLVKRENLTILFSSSGLGKTSLLRAGLFPLLRTNYYLPVYLRLDYAEGSLPLAEQVKKALAAACAVGHIDAPSPLPGECLWEYFHRTDVDFWDKRNRMVTPVLALDQFEELFTLGRNSVELERRGREFVEELSDLAENRRPAQIIRTHGADYSSHYDPGKNNVRIIISLREDFLADLEDLKSCICVNNRLRLPFMSLEQAETAMVKAGGHLLEDGLASKIADFVAGSSCRNEGSHAPRHVEPALLSVVCRELNLQRISRKLPRITEDILRGSSDHIIEDFYERSLKDIPEAVETFIEERLLTASGFRQTAALEDVLQIEGVSDRAVDLLVERRLLRFEDRFGPRHIELIHDVLTGAVMKRRDQRRLREKQSQLMEMKQRMRHWRLVAAGCAALVVIAILGVCWGIRGQRQAALANEQRDQALLGAQGLVESMLFELRDELIPIGELPLLEKVAKKVVDYYSNIPIEDPSPEVLRNKAVALINLGNVCSAQGKRQDAFDLYRSALEIYERSLLRRSPDNRLWQSDVAIVYDGIGVLLVDEGERDEAKTYFAKSKLIWEALVRGDSKTAFWQKGMAYSYDRMGRFLKDEGKWDDARSYYEKMKSIFETLVKNEPENTGWQRGLAVPYQRLGDSFMAEGKWDKARFYYQKFKSIMEPLAERNEDNIDWQRDIAIAYERIGRLLVHERRVDEALTLFEKQRAIHTEVVHRDPKSIQYRRDLASITGAIGEVLLAKGKKIEALDLFQKALKLIETVANSEQNVVNIQRDLSIDHDRVGDALLSLNKPSEALDLLDRSLSIRRHMAESNSADNSWQRDMAISYTKRGASLEALARNGEAQASFLNARKIIEGLSTADPANAGWLWDYTMNYPRFEEFLGAVAHVLLLSPDDPALWNLKGLVLRSMGRRDESLVAVTKAIGLAERSRAGSHKNSQYLLNRARLYDELGQSKKASADRSAAGSQ